MKTPEQLKGAIRNIAKEKDLHAQEVLHIFMFERILDRLSLSPYKKNFVLKGGLLICKRYIGHLKYEKPRAAIIRSPQKNLFFFHSADVRDGI